MAVLAVLLPLTVEDYLALPEDGEFEREIIRGRLSVSPRPGPVHQWLMGALHRLLVAYVLRRGGREEQVLLDADLLLDAVNTYVSPDLMYFSPDAVPALLELGRLGRRIHVLVVRPEVVVELLSPDGRDADLVEKRRDYAAAGIPHYWALDAQRRVFHEFVLYAERGEYTELVHTGGRVRPRLFAEQRPPLTLDVNRVWGRQPR